MLTFRVWRNLFILIVIGGIAFVVLRTGTPSVPVPDRPAPFATVAYSCSANKTMTAAYYAGEEAPAPVPGEPPVPTGSVVLSLSDGRVMTLARTLSADGMRYASDGESFIFWSRGNGALVLENTQEKSYIGCIAVAPEPTGKSLPVVYSNSGMGFSLRLPSLAGSISKNHLAGYSADEKYRYQELGPGKDIAGIKFTIPSTMATGTNLSSNTYLSIEAIPDSPICTAALFIERGMTAYMIPEGNVTYSIASSTGAAAGNRYDETVYALPDTNPCFAVRYYVHYGDIGNYPKGAVREFDYRALLAEFDTIRRTLVVQ